MNKSALLTFLAALMAATNTVTASELLEPMYPEQEGASQFLRGPTKEARLDAARLDAARLDAARLDAARLDAARLDAARLDAARLDAARVDAARVDEEAVTKKNLFGLPVPRGVFLVKGI